MNTFTAVVLPNWVRFDLTQPVKEPLAEAVGAMLADVAPATARRVRPYLFDRLFELLTGLAGAGAMAVFMPAEDPTVASAFPLFAVSPADFAVDGEPMEPMDFLIGLVGGGSATLIEPPGMVGVRQVVDRDTSAALTDELAGLSADMREGLDTERSEAAAAAGRLSREISYVIGVPETEDRWLSITASISVIRGEGSDELLDAVTDFADRWVETISWNEEDGNA